MQSFLQHRRFKKHVTRQFERDKEKAEALRRSNAELDLSPSVFPTTSANPYPASTDESIDTRDPEKGEHSNGHDLEHDPEKGELSSGLESEHDLESEQFNDHDPEKEELDFPPTAEEAMDGGPTHISRALTAATQHTVGTALGTALTGIHVRDRTTREGGDKGKVFVVGYEGEHDNMDPHNWSFLLRLRATYESPLLNIEPILTFPVSPLHQLVGLSDSPRASIPPLFPKRPKSLESVKSWNHSRLVYS